MEGFGIPECSSVGDELLSDLPVNARGGADFLKCSGEMADRIRAFEWASTPLGPIEVWPQSLKTATGLVIAAPVPIVMLWGEQGVMIYNDAYSVFASGRHPRLLGCNVREGWPEIAEFNDNVMKVGLAGGTLAYKDQELTLHRTGRPEQVWMDLDYWPVPGDDGEPAGVIATVVETTNRIKADRRSAALQDRQRQMLQQMPGFVSMLSGPEHVFEYVNDAYIALSGQRQFIGRSVRDVFPELVGQGFYELLDSVYSTGQRFVARGIPVHLERVDGDRFIDLLYEPIRNSSGEVSGIFVGGYDVTDNHQGAAALAESEARYRALFTAVSSGFCIIEMRFDADRRPVDYKIVEGNAAFAEMTGLQDADGKWVSEIAPGLEQHWFDLYGGVAMTGVPVRFENPADILGRWYDVEAFRIGEPEARRVAVLFNNITERKQIEARQAALLELNDAIRDLEDSDDIAAASAAVLARALNVSRAGYGTVDPIAETITIYRDFNAPGVTSIAGTLAFRDHGSYIEDIKRGETVAIADVGLDPRTRDTADVLRAISAASFINMPLVEQGRVVAMVFVNNATPRVWTDSDLQLIREVAERVRTASERARSQAKVKRQSDEMAELNVRLEEALAGSRAERDRLWTLSQDMLARADYGGGLNAVNPAWTKVLGWTEDELLTNPYADIIHPDHIGATLEALEDMLATGEPTRFENCILSKDGRWMPIGWTVSPEPDGEHFIAIGRDLAEDKAREQQLVEAQEALRQSQKMEAVGQLTGGIAHDFNNLLAGISGSLELLGKRLSAGRLNGMERYIDAAQGSAQRAASLTQRLLAFSRRQTLDPKPTDVNRLIGGMEDLIRRSVGPDIEVEVVGAGGLWTTRIDPSQLENALLNLCINARDAMTPDGGRLTIETANRWLDDRTGRDRDLVPGQYVSLCVTDTGVGMTPDIQAQVFDPFFTTKPLGQGTGLGLSMIHGFVRQSGGQVRVYSEVGKGTTMCLYLPRYTGDLEIAEDEILSSLPRSGQGETVLVIDDEETVRMLVAEILTEAGYHVIEAPDGPSGLEVLRAGGRIDLLITDVGLPGGMNGRQVADAAREARPGLKVLFVTGYAENAAVGNGHLDVGMEVMTKPFAMVALGEKVREMIER